MRRSLIALALLVPLVSQPAFFDSFWNLLSAAWANSWLDAGCGADPNGICTTSSDGGCGADPDGRCATTPQPQTDEGCGADPDGRPRCSS